MRPTHSQLLEVLRHDYSRTAWAKGLRERVTIVRHALRNALINRIAKIETPDKYTVKFTMNKPYAPFLSYVTSP